MSLGLGLVWSSGISARTGEGCITGRSYDLLRPCDVISA